LKIAYLLPYARNHSRYDVLEVRLRSLFFARALHLNHFE